MPTLTPNALTLPRARPHQSPPTPLTPHHTGFEAGVSAINGSSSDAAWLSEVASSAVAALSRREARAGADAAKDERTRRTTAALQFVYRGAMEHDVTAEDLGAALQQATNFAPRAVAIVCESYGAWQAGAETKDAAESKAGAGGGGAAAVRDIVNVGKLLRMDWKAGVSVQSSQCKALKVPFVSLVLHVLEGGRVAAHPVELTIAEFQVRVQ